MIENEMFCEVMCRACLGSGRLYNIHEHRLADSYNNLIGTKVMRYDGLPQHLCAMCSTMLVKYAEFRSQCLNAQLVLNDVKKRQNVITSNSATEMKHRYSQTITKVAEYVHNATIDKDTYLDDRTIKNKDIDNSEKSIEIDMDGNNLCGENQFTDEIVIKTNTKEKGKEFDNVEKDKEKKKAKKQDKVEKDIIGKEDESTKAFKKVPRLDRIKGKYFETKENLTNFEIMYDVKIVILSKEQQLRDVLERKNSDNYVNSPFKCQQCYRGYIDEDNLKKHFISQHDPIRGEVLCEFCQYRYKDKRGLNQHLKSHRLKFICRQCKYVSRTTFNAKEHYKMHRGVLHECKECGKSYEKLSTYLTHTRIHHAASLPWCDLCGAALVGDLGLRGHKKRAHRDVQFPPDCACPCGSSFTNTSALQHHASSQGCGQASCPHCGVGFTDRNLLRDHLRDQHRVNDKTYACTECDKSFPREALYTAHYRRVHSPRVAGAQPCVCEVCGKTLPTRSRLLYHQRTHSGEKPYQCPRCPRSFTLRKLLASHSRVHSAARPFACASCPKTYKGPSGLRAHHHIHAAEGKNATTKNIRV